MSRTEPQSADRTVPGSCFCGAVQFELDLPSKWCAHCHCTMCRRIHGAGYVTWVGVDNKQFRLLADEQLRWFASSPEARRGFCTICGSSLFFTSERWSGETHIALGCINGEIDRKPQAHASHASHVDWMPLDESLPISSS